MQHGERNQGEHAQAVQTSRQQLPPLRTRGMALLLSGALTGGCLPYGRTREAKPAAPILERYASPRAHAESESSGGDAPSSAPQPENAAQRVSEPAQSASSPRVAKQDERWWEGFGDPALSELIKRALDANLDLSIARERVQQARALATQAAAARWPQINAQGDASWSRSPLAFAGANADQLTLRGSLPVSYEVDWFARNAGRAEAAKLDMAAARADAEAAAISVAAQVAEAWFDVVEARARVALLTEQLQINESFLELTTLRFRQGLTTALDAHQQRQQVAATQAQKALAEAGERIAENQLALLLGKAPDGERFAADVRRLPDLPARPAEGLPASLLVSRPDVRAAARRVEAADERVAVAIASRLPSLTISGSPGYTYTNFKVVDADTLSSGAGGSFSAFSGSRTTKGPSYNVGAQLNIPLFDGFQRKAEVDLNRSRTREAIDSHSRVLQRAVSEVDSALASERSQDEHIAALEAQLAAATDALDSARESYRQGLNDFLPVLQALTGMQQTQLALLSARRQQLSFRVQLHRALGGTWPRELDAPKSRKGSDE